MTRSAVVVGAGPNGLAAVQERCRDAPGELRVVTLESQPAHVQRQRYRIWDAADGLVEEGWVDVRKMVRRQPWLGDEPFPLHREGTGKSTPHTGDNLTV